MFIHSSLIGTVNGDSNGDNNGNNNNLKRDVSQIHLAIVMSERLRTED